MKNLLKIFFVLSLAQLLSPVLAKAYAVSGARWPNQIVKYYINTANVEGLDPAAIRADIEAAGAAWHNQGGVSLTLTDAGPTNSSTVAADGTNNIFFRNDGGSYVAYTTYWWNGNLQLIDSDIVINETYPQITSAMPCNGGLYIQNTITHEFGHFIGLNHSDVPTATMWPSEGYCEVDKESLDPDDIAGVQSVYTSGTSQYSHISLSPTSLYFSSNSGISPAPQVVNLANSGAVTMNWIASANQSWCHAIPSSGSLPPGGSVSFSVSPDPINSGGSFTCSVAVSDSKADNNPQYVSVSDAVAGIPDTTPPTVSIISPVNNAKVSGGVSISAMASDDSGISKVEFYIDNTLKASDSSYPYSYRWNVNKQVASGTHTITAKAYDKASPANTSTAQITVFK